MSTAISQITLACAGAGKTYTMANDVLNQTKQADPYKKTYVLSYTNSAKDKILERIYELNGSIPDNIEVCTIHTFLLNEIIYPFSKYSLGYIYTRSSSCELDKSPQYANYKINLLKNLGIIHNSKVSNIAKQILVGKSKSTKKEKGKINVVFSHIKGNINSIYIDEAQDLDEDLIAVFKKFAEEEILVNMVGDPKQNIKNPEPFRLFINDIVDNKLDYFILNYNNKTRRLPEKHKTLSNLLCSKDEQQNTESKVDGEISFLFSDDKIVEDLYEKFVNRKDNKEVLMYTEKRDGTFETKKTINTKELPDVVQKKIKGLAKKENADEDAYMFSYIKKLEKRVNEIGEKKAVNEQFKKLGFDYDNKLYAEFCEALKSETTKTEIKFNIMTIDFVKGLEAVTCIFVINNALLNYLFSEKTEENKMKNKLYVALTRSLKDLIFIVNLNGLKYSKDDVIREFERLLISEYKNN